MITLSPLVVIGGELQCKYFVNRVKPSLLLWNVPDRLLVGALRLAGTLCALTYYS